MKYIIMCGGNYKDQFETPKPLLVVDKEILVERTIRLLRENGITDIAISTDIDDYNYLDVEILKRDNHYVHDKYGYVKKSQNAWLTAYYPLETPACYLAGDVYWTDLAIKSIINIEVENTMFICAPDICDGRKNPSIKGREPLGYKVVNQKMFRQAINDILKEVDAGRFTKDPISWNLYRKLNNIGMDYNGYGNDIFKTNGDFMVIDDLTTDIDLKKNIPALEKLIKIERGEIKMVILEAKEEFHLGRFNELRNIKRHNPNKNDNGHIYAGDVFECDVDLAKYLLNEKGYENPVNKAFVDKILEVVPDEIEVKENIVKHSETEKLVNTDSTLVKEEKDVKRKKTPRRRKPIA